MLKRGTRASDGVAVPSNHLSSPVVTEATHLGESLGALRRLLDTDVAAFHADDGLAPRDVQGPARILVVDDDAAVRRHVKELLEGAGYDVRDVGTAWEARQALERESIALLLSEVSMPRETGLDLVRFAQDEHPTTATLLMSAREDPGIALAAMDLGASGFLTKPLSRSAVLIGVMTALRQRDAQARERAERDRLERSLSVRTGALLQTLEQLEGAADQGRVLQVETILRWAQAAEYMEPGIGRHIKRMSRYCGVLGRAFGLHLESLELASALHDVGKAQIPDSILLKPGTLTDDERLAIETHPAIGYEMLRDSGSHVLDLAAIIARTPHEKFDGSGYPRRLAGTEIPLEGRIAAVADVFDAMTCDRAYREAWSLESTIDWMTCERGKHFDPAVLDALLASMDEIVEIREELISG